MNAEAVFPSKRNRKVAIPPGPESYFGFVAPVCASDRGVSHFSHRRADQARDLALAPPQPRADLF